MKSVMMLLAIAVLTLTSASTAHAGAKSLASAPAALYGFGQILYCDITNVDQVKPVEVTTEILDYSGNVVTGPQIETLSPNTGGYLGTATASAAWCRFTINGSTKNVRAMAVYDNGTTYTMSIPAY